MRGFKLGAVLLALVTSQWAAAQLYRDRFTTHTLNDVTMLPAGWPDIEEFRSALQNFVTSLHDRGFRHLGDTHDFFHGHLLYHENSLLDRYGAMRPVAILYHTQEDAAEFHAKDPGGPYDYIDTRRRNWLQFFDGARNSSAIFNAYNFMYRFFPRDEGAQRDLNSSRERFTVHASAIDDTLFPGEYAYQIVGQRQLDFHSVNCSDHTSLYPTLFYRPVIQIEVPDALAPVCLELQSESPYLPQPRYSRTGRDIFNSTIPELPDEDRVGL